MNPLKQSMMSKRSVKSLMANKSRLTKKSRNRFLLLLKLYGKEWVKDAQYCDICEFSKGVMCIAHLRKKRFKERTNIISKEEKYSMCGDFEPRKQK